MVVATREAQTLTDLELMAHLYRRAGFGATRDELDAALERGYEATVDELVNPERVKPLDHWLMWRYYVDIKELKQSECGEAYFVYRMINSPRPLEEKLTLFFHGLFATAWSKVAITKTLCNQLDMFRENCLGDYRTLLVKMAKDPTMIFWLDNQMNTKDAPNENFGRELLELFSMGIGNYTEHDVKECARAFTGWGLENTIPGRPAVRAVRLAVPILAGAPRRRREDVPGRDRHLRRRGRDRHHRPAAGDGPIRGGEAVRLLRLGHAERGRHRGACRGLHGDGRQPPRDDAPPLPGRLVPLGGGAVREGEGRRRAHRLGGAAGRRLPRARPGGSTTWPWSACTSASSC